MIWNALHGMNGLTCLGLVLLPFILMGVVAYENSRKPRRAKIRAVTHPRYTRRRSRPRGAYVTHDARGARRGP